MSRALVIVDYQNDFVSGSLAVPGAADALPLIRQLAESGDYDMIVGTRDWHPADHCSFAEQGGQWPSHCVQGTNGAAYAGGVERLIAGGGHFFKGDWSAVEEYSGALARSESGQPLTDALANGNVTDVDVVGLALDYCVVETAIELSVAEFKVRVILDGTRAVNPEDGLAAIGRLRSAGVEIA